MKKNVREKRIPKIKVNGGEFERVSSFRYLGSLVTSNNQMTMRIEGELNVGNR